MSMDTLDKIIISSYSTPFYHVDTIQNKKKRELLLRLSILFFACYFYIYYTSAFINL
jgi:hypothetical protein